jgi:hypothetical protein
VLGWRGTTASLLLFSSFTLFFSILQNLTSKVFHLFVLSLDFPETCTVPCSLLISLKVLALRLALSHVFFNLFYNSAVAASKAANQSIQTNPLSSFSESFIYSDKQGGATVLGEGHDIVTRNLPSYFSEIKHLRKSSCAAFYSPVQLGPCQTQPADYLTQLC